MMIMIILISIIIIIIIIVITIIIIIIIIIITNAQKKEGGRILQNLASVRRVPKGFWATMKTFVGNQGTVN